MTTTHTRARAALLVATLGALGSALALAMSGCAPPPTQPLVRHEAPAEVEVSPARPCTRDVTAAAPPAPPPPTAVEARFDPTMNTIVLTAGQGVTLPALAQAVGNPDLVREVAPGEWLLGVDLTVLPGTSVLITAPTTRWLKLLSTAGRFASVKAFGGNVDVSGACITSWDVATGTVDTESADGRGYLLARDGAQMNIDRAEIRYLGHGDVESYGLAWRIEGTGGKITNSIVSHNYYGFYSYEIGGLVVADNEFHDNELYGIDPHTGSHNLTIERNVVHDNGKHGIVLAEDCVDSVVRDNIVYRNDHHGIVLYLRSDRNTIEGQRHLRQRRPRHQHQRVPRQRHPRQPRLRQRRVRHRHHPDLREQRRREQPDPWQRAGRDPHRQRGGPHHAPREHGRRERPLRRLRGRQRAGGHRGQPDLRQPVGDHAEGFCGGAGRRQRDLRQPGGSDREGLAQRAYPAGDRPCAHGRERWSRFARSRSAAATDSSTDLRSA